MQKIIGSNMWQVIKVTEAGVDNMSASLPHNIYPMHTYYVVPFKITCKGSHDCLSHK